MEFRFLNRFNGAMLTHRIVIGQNRSAKIDFAIRDHFVASAEPGLATILVLSETGLALIRKPGFGIRHFGLMAISHWSWRQKRTSQAASFGWKS